MNRLKEAMEKRPQGSGKNSVKLIRRHWIKRLECRFKWDHWTKYEEYLAGWAPSALGVDVLGVMASSPSPSPQSGCAKTRFDRSRAQFTVWQSQMSNRGQSCTLCTSTFTHGIALEAVIDLVNLGLRSGE
jgi:hypothetical protein